MDIFTVFIALAAGVLSFLSPCVFPLIPAYVSHLTGSAVHQNKINVDRKRLLLNSLSFIVGFSSIFIAMGASASAAGQVLASHRDVVQKLSGLIIIVFGMQMIGWLNLKMLELNKSWDMGGFRSANGVMKSFLTGLAFGTGWTPCVGLALSSILLMASSSETLWSGMLMLTVYSAGLGIPFLLISFALTYSTGILKRMNRFIPILSKINGVIFLVMGLLLFTGQMERIGAWLARFVIVDISL